MCNNSRKLDFNKESLISGSIQLTITKEILNIIIPDIFITHQFTVKGLTLKK